MVTNSCSCVIIELVTNAWLFQSELRTDRISGVLSEIGGFREGFSQHSHKIGFLFFPLLELLLLLPFFPIVLGLVYAVVAPKL